MGQAGSSTAGQDGSGGLSGAANGGSMAGSAQAGSAQAGSAQAGATAGAPIAGGAGGGAATAGASGSESGAEPTEKALPDLPAVRQEHSVAALRGEVYVIGGFTPSATSSVAAYNPVTDLWRSVASLPVVVQHANAATVGERIYVAGFYLGGSFSDADPRVFEYNPDEDAWTEQSSMPAGSERASACVAVFDHKIYLFGGARSSTVSDASAYDTVQDSWEALPPLPEPREHCLAAAVGETLYIASGRSGSITSFQPKTWAYDPTLRSYEEKTPIPTPRGGTAGAVLGGRLLVFGGEGSAVEPRGVFPNVEAYDPATNTWEPLPDMMVPRHGFGAAVLDGRIYLPGGATSQGFGAVGDVSVFWYE